MEKNPHLIRGHAAATKLLTDKGFEVKDGQIVKLPEAAKDDESQQQAAEAIAKLGRKGKEEKADDKKGEVKA